MYLVWTVPATTAIAKIAIATTTATITPAVIAFAAWFLKKVFYFFKVIIKLLTLMAMSMKSPI